MSQTKLTIQVVEQFRAGRKTPVTTRLAGVAAKLLKAEARKHDYQLPLVRSVVNNAKTTFAQLKSQPKQQQCSFNWRQRRLVHLTTSWQSLVGFRFQKNYPSVTPIRIWRFFVVLLGEPGWLIGWLAGRNSGQAQMAGGTCLAEWLAGRPGEWLGAPSKRKHEEETRGRPAPEPRQVTPRKPGSRSDVGQTEPPD